MEKLPEMLRKRADEYEAPYQGNRLAFNKSGASFAIATVFREMASMIERAEKGDDPFGVYDPRPGHD
jgi:hypothetical protein